MQVRAKGAFHPGARCIWCRPRGWGVVVDTAEPFTSYAERFEKEKYCFTRTTHQKWPGTGQKTGIEADVINAINSISSSSSWGLLRPSSCLRRGFFICAKVPAAWRWRCVNSSHGSRDQWPLAREFATTGNKVREGSAVQIASASVSLVRIRTTWSRPYTKILPSPIFPVFADEVIVLMILST